MRYCLLRCAALVAGSLTALAWSVSAIADDQLPGWGQWGQNPQHTGQVGNEGQDAASILADKIYDPLVAAETASTGGDLLVHYQVPLLDGNDVFMEFKSGTFTGNNTWNTQIWNEKKLQWQGNQLNEAWNFQSDWKPVPRITTGWRGIWEPVFHAVLAGNSVYVPGFGGTIFKLNKSNGQGSRVGTLDANTFVAGPLSTDATGNIYYNAIKLSGAAPFDLVDSWLVKVSSNGTVTRVSYGTLLAPANPPTTCSGTFSNNDTPWPPSPSAQPASGPCGSQRPGLNIAPAIAGDGTIYVASRAHNRTSGAPGSLAVDGSRYSYLVAVNPDLTLKWATSLRNQGIDDGCGVLIPNATAQDPVQKGKCSYNAPTGVDPEVNDRPAGRLNDSGTASPTVLPDGDILFGTYTRYNVARGHLFKFGRADGKVLASFDFGWDDTLAVVPRDNGYSIVMKDNHYDEESGFYCNPGASANSQIVCSSTGIPAGPFYITQVDKNLVPEWKFQSTETRTCHRNLDGSVTCVDDGTHPNGFEWCINAPAIDSAGNVYVESEDGFFYVLDQTHSGVFTTPKAKLFLNSAIGAAYTPFSIDDAGRLYAQNNGHLFVIGSGGTDVRSNDESRGPHTQKRHDPEIDD